MGEVSRLTFAPLRTQGKSPLPVDVAVQLADPNERIVYGKPFTIILSIRNKSEVPATLSLRLPMATFSPVMPANALQEQLGSLAVHNSIERRVEMIPLACGLHKIEGIVAMDSKRTKYVARPISVFVDSE